MDGVHFVIFFILSLLLVAGLHFIFVLHATSIVFRTMAPNAVNTTSSLTIDGRPPRFRRVQRFSAPQESYPFSPYVKDFSYFLHAHANMGQSWSLGCEERTGAGDPSEQVFIDIKLSVFSERNPQFSMWAK